MTKKLNKKIKRKLSYDEYMEYKDKGSGYGRSFIDGILRGEFK